jgi:hypothetical protein
MTDLNTAPAPGTAPTDEQITAMLEELLGLSDKAAATDNTDLLNAHTKVLTDKLSTDDVDSQFGGDDSPFDEDDMKSLRDSCGWLLGQGDGTPASSLEGLFDEDEGDDPGDNLEGDEEDTEDEPVC